ncbi:hypothetical protein [Clostridium sp.]|uniref:hypothetical protein n=1 Tax=Clostridium sp. TaxID=1506 RepID=UPI00260ABDB5|nr:hypothetical protein [Clostridium sp.]
MDNEKAFKHIKNAYCLAILSGVMTLILTMLSILGIWDLGLDLSELLEVVLVLGLAFGVSKKSRVCAIALFIYYTINKAIMIFSNGGIVGLAIIFIFAIGYFQGIRGTLHYHKNIKLEKMNDETLDKDLSV